ncbi:MAG: hypothetical protein P9X24_16845 [Candidatus Hatepunaea meridiana]|nr:hypothetical protein [Candidatus Hatepunaea meridiana]
MYIYLRIKQFSSIFICIIVAFCTVIATAGDWKLHKPISGEKANLIVNGKKRNYWKLDKANSIIVNINGPSELKIITRMVLEKKKREGVYSFITHIDGERQSLTARATEYIKSTINSKNKNQRIGCSRSIIFSVPSGKHEYRFSIPDDSNNIIYTRFLTPDGNKEKISYIAYLPRSFPEEVRVNVKEREYIYYRSSIGKPVEVEVIGPTQIKCISRLEYNHSTHGNKPYRIQVLEGDKIILTDFFTSDISGTASYAEKSNKVIGKGNASFINVPTGKHLYQVSTPDTDISIVLRFYLPESDLENEESNRSTTQIGFIRCK